MKIYECAICKKRGESFRGTRKDVRKHIFEVHKIRGEGYVTSATGKRFEKSNVTQNMISEEFK